MQRLALLIAAVTVLGCEGESLRQTTIVGTQGDNLSGPDAAKACSHDPCATGAKLSSTCDPCVAQICAQDGFCCQNKWDAQCVNGIASVCSLTCGSGTGGGGGGGTSGGGQSCTVVNGTADVRCTPGAFNPAVTQATIGSTICVSGWTSTVRPPSSFTTALKDQQKPEYGEANDSDADLEEDHLVPLELGGAPRDPNNLWPQPRQSIAAPHQGAETKDSEENALKQQVCSGQMTLAAARQKILADWTH